MSAKISIGEQIAEVEREIALRKNVYPTFIANKRMTQADANQHRDRLEAALVTLLWCRDNEAAIRAWAASREPLRETAAPSDRARHPDALDQALGSNGATAQ